MMMKHTKKSLKKVAGSIWLCCCALLLIVMLYGLIRYPSAPIRLRDGGYFDKAGQQYTEAQFRSFQLWERCLLGAFAVVGVAGVSLALLERKNRNTG